MESVVSTKWLDQELKNHDSKIVVLDTTWFNFKDAMSEIFSQKHIVQANYFDLMFGVKSDDVSARQLPTPEMFELNARGSAVDNDSHVVLYDATRKCGFFAAARAWWMFKLFGHEKVSVLDGGLEKWIADGFDTTNMNVKKREGNFLVKSSNNAWITTFDEMKDNVKNKKFQVCDSRAHGTYCNGHYPDSCNLPFLSLFNEETNSLKSIAELKQLFRESGTELEKPIVTMSSDGMSSCAVALAAHVSGCPDVKVYHGGFVEWKSKTDLSFIEVTPE